MSEFNVKLTSQELKLLDGQCSPEVQAQVDLVRDGERISQRYALGEQAGLFVARVRETALERGKLSFQHARMYECQVSGKQAPWITPTRKTRDNPYKQPVRVPFVGYELGAPNIIMENHPRLGICSEAMAELKPVLAQELAHIEAEIPETVTGSPSRYKCENIVEHENCWIGRQSLLGGGDQDNYSRNRECPCCGKVFGIFASGLNFTGKHEVVSLEQLEREREERAQKRERQAEEKREEYRASLQSRV